jgi:hypothetical protein
MTDKEKINEFLSWLDSEGYNMWIISAIRTLLLKDKELKSQKEVWDNQMKVEEIAPFPFDEFPEKL